MNGNAPVATTALIRRTLFLRWLCIGTAPALALAALALGGFAAGVSGAPLAVALVIVAATVAIGALACVLHWRAVEALAPATPASSSGSGTTASSSTTRSRSSRCSG